MVSKKIITYTSFPERFKEVEKELEKNCSTKGGLIVRLGLEPAHYYVLKRKSRQDPENMEFLVSTVESIASANDIHPLVFFKMEDGKPENLGFNNFPYEIQEIPNYLGRVFKKYREARGLSQYDLAKELKGIFPPYLSLYESGKFRPFLSKLETISTGLDLIPQFLLPQGHRNPVMDVEDYLQRKEVE